MKDPEIELLNDLAKKCPADADDFVRPLPVSEGYAGDPSTVCSYQPTWQPPCSRMSAQVQVPMRVLAALVEDCRTYGLCGKYLGQAEDLLEAARPKKQGVEERGPLRVFVTEPADEHSCYAADGTPCARLSDASDPDCNAVNALRPCWKSPSIIWREVK